MASVLPIGDCVEAEIELGLDDVLDVTVLGLAEGRGGLLAGFPGVPGVEEVVGAQEGAEMLGAEGWVAVEGAGVRHVGKI